MRVERLAILLLVVLMLARTASAQEASQSTAELAHMSIQGRIEYGYALLFASVKFPRPVNSFSLNISDFGDRILLAFARVDSQQVSGRVSGELLTFEFTREFTEANVTLVISALSANATTLSVALPVPLAPLGVITNVTGSFTIGTAFTVETILGSSSQGVVKYNLTAVPSACDVVRAWAPLSSVQMVRVTFLNRTILLSPGKVEYVDSLHLVSEGEMPTTSLRLTLPSAFTLDAVEASLFKYPSRYISQYSAKNETLIVISLLPALQGAGQRSIITLRYSSPLNGTVDAYMGLGPFIQNYTVRVCIEGTATLSPSASRVEKVGSSMQCYSLPPAGPLLQPGMYSPVRVTPSFAQTSGGFLPLIGVVITVAVVGAAGYLVLRKERPKEQAVLEKAAEEGSAEKVRKLIEDWRNDIITLVKQLREYRARGAGTTKMISLLNSHMRRDSAFSSELRAFLTTLGQRGEKALGTLATIESEINSCVESLLEVERLYRRGRITKHEYKQKVDELEEKLLRLAESLGRVYRQLPL